MPAVYAIVDTRPAVKLATPARHPSLTMAERIAAMRKLGAFDFVSTDPATGRDCWLFQYTDKAEVARRQAKGKPLSHRVETLADCVAWSCTCEDSRLKAAAGFGERCKHQECLLEDLAGRKAALAAKNVAPPVKTGWDAYLEIAA